MKTHLALRILSWSTITILLCALQPGAQAAPVPVRFTNGTLHGFLELRSAEGHVLASGDLIQVAHGNQVTTRLLFTFKDGSIDDETTVFSQHRNFQLITYHHIQKGTSFPHPIDLLIDARSGKVTLHPPPEHPSGHPRDKSVDTRGHPQAKARHAIHLLPWRRTLLAGRFFSEGDSL